MIIILKVIDAEINNFIEIYHQRPKFIKVPLWIYCKIKNTYGSAVKYKNLLICETISISQINEIEVF